MHQPKNACNGSLLGERKILKVANMETYGFHSSFMQVRAEIQKAKLGMLFALKRMPTEDEIIEKVGISPERYHEVMRASKPVFSLHSRHTTTQEEFINGITDVDGVEGDNRQKPALLRLALDDVVFTYPLR